MKAIFTILCIIISLYSVNACSCIQFETFCETVTFGGDGRIIENMVIFHGKVVSQEGVDVNVKIERLFHGAVSDNEVKIDGSITSFCQPITHDLARNRAFIFAAYQQENGSLSFPACGVRVLPIINNTVIGKIKGNTSFARLNNFQNTLSDCAELIFPGDIRIFPNPVFENIKLEAIYSAGTKLELTIFNAKGQKVIDQTWDDATIVIKEIPFADYPSGIYFLQFKINGIVQYKKVVKAN